MRSAHQFSKVITMSLLHSNFSRELNCENYLFNQVMLNVADVRSAQVKIDKFTEILKTPLATTFTIMKDSFSISFSFSFSPSFCLSLCL